MKPSFRIVSKDKKARAGEIVTPHGVIKTPAFFPVGTKGTLKSLTGAQIREIGPQAVLGNTYHLMLQPGADLVKKMGGLAKMLDWNGPTFTDSGGFQVFSLGVGLEIPDVKFLKENALRSKSSIEEFSDGKHPSVRKGELGARSADSNENFSQEIAPRAIRLNQITEEGVTFQSHIDGSRHMLSPESSIAIQEKLGADLIVGFDDLESPTYDEARTKKSLVLTEKWLLRSLEAQKRTDQLLYGVTHGGQFESLRCESAKFVNSNFDAIAMGGAHASKKNLYEVIEWTVKELDEEKPRHLLGIGEVDDIFEAVERGVDTFDCVIPTRLGRMGHVFVSPKEGNVKNRFRFDITKSKFASDLKPIDPNCDCYVCKTHPRAYINHLFRSRELLAYTLASYHNVYFMVNLTNKIRESIIEGNFQTLKKSWIG